MGREGKGFRQALLRGKCIELGSNRGKMMGYPILGVKKERGKKSGEEINN